MGARDRWGSGGPEALSVRQWLDALREHHCAVCRYSITPSGNDATSHQLRVKLTAEPGPIPELYSGPLKPMVLEADYPSGRYRSLESLLFALAVRMDRELGNSWWEQKELPF